MAKTKSMTRSQNSFNVPWSCLNHDVLFLVMMQIGVVDFVAFSGVCKSWRSLALSNKRRFMASKPPMKIRITDRGNEKECRLHLQDYEGRSKKMLLPESGGRTCVGITCGYLVLFQKRTRDFLLLNPITRHGLHFPQLPEDVNPDPVIGGVRAILVFLSTMSVWVFVVSYQGSNTIWFSTVGNRKWKHLSFRSFYFNILDLTEFKGKIYAINNWCCLFEFKLDPAPTLRLLNPKDYPLLWGFRQFVCSDERLFAMGLKDDIGFNSRYHVFELDVGEMKFVSPEENTLEEHAFFRGKLKHNTAVVKTGLCSDSWCRYKDNGYAYKGISMFYTTDIWYPLNDCMKVNFKY